MTSEKTQLRLAEHLDRRGRITSGGADALIEAVRRAQAAAVEAGCEELLALATSAVRDAGNAASVLRRVQAETGVGLQVLPGEDEARYAFLAVRRWYGWWVGRLLVLDIGGGSLELAAGRDDDPDVAVSLPLGAGRLTRRWFGTDPPSRAVTGAPRLRYRTYNVASGSATTNTEIIAAIKTVVPDADLNLPSGGPKPETHLDITRIHDDTGYQPEHDTERAATDYIAWLCSGNDR